MSLRLHATFASVLAIAALAHPSADAKPKKGATGACGIDFLPLVKGAAWTYEFFIPENMEPAPGLRVMDPETVTIKIADIENKGGKTIISVEESYRKVVSKNQLVCTKETLMVPPSSFFFTGQPGGGLGMDIAESSVKGESFLTKKGLKEDTYQEFVTTATRKPTEGSGAVIDPARLEIERKMTILGRQEAESGLGVHKATRVDVRMTGRAALNSQKDKPFNMPEVHTAMWFASGVGVVRVESSLARGWKLTEHKPAGE